MAKPKHRVETDEQETLAEAMRRIEAMAAESEAETADQAPSSIEDRLRRLIEGLDGDSR
ncbi:hypothetical protein [Magnetospirillum sp. UT-4]|uniref:hypothetical protein n=1 Tax=Magnetospirillum sp. UT-4 TaxID=2681467 RepID=UPI00137FA514|nr:hypothetical protein [Magnetospirillum sp. UT-4]CAA7626952.1 hypothetical protein MTBUT4_90031 [Magnetospirillum sp. UT-4]